MRDERELQLVARRRDAVRALRNTPHSSMPASFN
jgi:hypothetical protein